MKFKKESEKGKDKEKCVTELHCCIHETNVTL